MSEEDDRRKEFFRNKGMNDYGTEHLPLLPKPWFYSKREDAWTNGQSGKKISAEDLRFKMVKELAEKIR